MFDIGASLAAARESRGLSLADAERLTNVRPKYLAALERADFEALPGRTYARAFLRTYAAALDLDADRFVAAFEEVVPEPVDEPIAVVAPRRRRIRVRHVLAALTVAVVAVVVTVAATSRTASRTPPPAAIVNQKPRPSSVLGARHTRAKPTPAVHRAVPRTLVIRATRGDCWVLARRGGPAGTIVYEGTLHEGGTLRFGRVTLWLRLGAPAMVDVTRAGKPVAGIAGSAPLNVTT